MGTDFKLKASGGHGFDRGHRARFDEAATKTARERTLKFFGKDLG